MSQAYAAEQRLSGILRPAAGHLISRTRMGHDASSLAEILRFCGRDLRSDRRIRASRTRFYAGPSKSSLSDATLHDGVEVREG